ncbi:hypothetical protein [Pseudonocardia oceani]|uniref:hypothetical protein n=1 Tax=Pseudonocardia oceani TaxID=2792013 RepID=UPI001C49D66C|nr:hypothetical protein [Pseudonocardia oceani]MBW0112063.1 hypothetical protein [Pseudonocardia oceani]
MLDTTVAVGARGFVEALPEGVDTDVRKRGGRLSAGQRQLVSPARVVLAGEGEFAALHAAWRASPA